MLIGLDFDNTIAGYDDVFCTVAESEGLIARGVAENKSQIREILRGQEDGEKKWMALQGRVYGAHMHRARLIDGVGDFMNRCAKSSIPVCIVSHKTRIGHFDPDKIDLQAAAHKWMEDHSFFNEDGFGLSRSSVFFEPTRADKVARISKLGCSHFVDDLEEVFLEPGFPKTVKRYLLAMAVETLPTGPFIALADWNSVADNIFDSF